MVEFKLTKEQLLAKELFRSFAENEIKPIPEIWMKQRNLIWIC